MTTVVQFSPSAQSAFTFQATLEGATANVLGVGPTYNVTVTWNVYGQRWYITIVDQNGTRVLTTPLIGSSSDYLISMTAGYFTTQLLYYPQQQRFVVN